MILFCTISSAGLCPVQHLVSTADHCIKAVFKHTGKAAAYCHRYLVALMHKLPGIHQEPNLFGNQKSILVICALQQNTELLTAKAGYDIR